jgi:hypothetical protein
MTQTTIVIPVSRPDYLRRIFAQLELMDCEREFTNLLVMVDGDLQLFEIARNLTVASKFAQKLCIYRKKGIPNVGSITRRRQRIADIHMEMKQYIKGADYIFMTEDDTLIPTNTLTKLLSHYQEHPHAGLISGVQIGRWGFDHIGAWVTNDVYEPTKFTTVKMESGVVKVDATGIYCCMTRFDNYMKFEFEPFENALGPDVAYGIYLRRQGYENFIDCSIQCDHLTKRGAIKFDHDLVQVELSKQGDGRWATKQL